MKRQLYNGSPSVAPIFLTDLQMQQKVPFYMYEGHGFDWVRNCSMSDPRPFEKLTNSKHGGEIHFIRQLRAHPWRVMDPNHAVIFIVPSLLGVAARVHGCGGMDHHQMIQTTTFELQKMPAFQNTEGRDHLILSTDFKAEYIKYVDESRDALKHLIWAGLCTKPMSTMCYLTVPFAGVLPPENTTSEALLSQSFQEFSARPIDLYFKGQVDHREAYQSRRILANVIKNMNYSKGVVYASSSLVEDSVFKKSCPERIEDCVLPVFNHRAGHKCVKCNSNTPGPVFAYELSQSKFCFSIEGDNERTSRLHEAIRMGCIPIIIGDHIWDIGQPADFKVPWWNMTYHIPLNELNATSVKRILNSSEEEIEYKRRLLREFAPDVLWDAKGSRVANNVLLEAYYRCIEPLNFNSERFELFQKNDSLMWVHVQSALLALVIVLFVSAKCYFKRWRRMVSDNQEIVDGTASSK